MNSYDVCALIDCTFRQLDYWARTGRITDTARGSGSRRRWVGSDIEVAWALARSSEVGSYDPSGDLNIPATVAEAVAARRVRAEGEWLVVTADGAAQRYDRLLLDDLTAFDAARVIRLRSFADTGIESVA